VTGGRNGYGAKLTNIFSTKFIVQTADKENGKCYKQVFEKNMSIKKDPVITANAKGEQYTCITFCPDLTRFNMQTLEKDIVSLMTKRVYDMAGVTPASVKVYLNDKRIDIKNFNDYVDLYLQTEENKALPKVKESNARWEVVASLSDGQPQQVSFVNSICTVKGGTHVAYLSD